MAAALEDLVLRLEAVTNKLECLVKNANICETEKQEILLEITEKSDDNSKNSEQNVSELLDAGTQPFLVFLTSALKCIFINPFVACPFLKFLAVLSDTPGP